MRPRISVVIPLYNHAGELPHCIASLKRQTLPPVEVVVVDDGSTDRGAAVAEEEKRGGVSWERFAIIQQENQGAAAARNAGFLHTSGDLIVFSDADIVWEMHAFERLATALEEHPDAAYAYSSFYFGRQLFRSGVFDANELKKVSSIHTSALIRRDAFPGFDPALKRFQDWDLWLTMLERGKRGVWVAEPLFRITPRTNGISEWLPRFMYRIPWQWFGFRIPAVERYRKAEAVIRRKHHLSL